MHIKISRSYFHLEPTFVFLFIPILFASNETLFCIQKCYFELDSHVGEHMNLLSPELDPSFRSALFNLALMLVNNLKRPLEAVPLLKSLIEVCDDGR